MAAAPSNGRSDRANQAAIPGYPHQRLFDFSTAPLADAERRPTNGAFRHDARLEEVPQGDQQLARQRDDPNPSQATTRSPEPSLIPAGERTPRLEAQPAPCDLDRHAANQAIAVTSDPLLAALVPALVRRRRESRERAQLLAIAEAPPAEELHHVQPRAVRADSL